MIHDLSGAVTDVGRRTRKIPPALRRALRERDRGRCQYPGCDSRRTDAHHIRYWANGGKTNLANLISFCKTHHRLVHEKNYRITPAAAGFAFCTSNGTPVPNCPQLPQGTGDITTTHNAAITPTTINPPHSGERLNLSLAILDRIRQRPHPSHPCHTTTALTPPPQESARQHASRGQPYSRSCGSGP